MNYSDSIKAILLAAINDLSKTPEKYAVKPGVDFIRNRKLGFKDYMLMFLTMEADCIREEMYRFFGRTIDAPSKAAFYRQRKKIREDAFRNLLLAFNSRPILLSGTATILVISFVIRRMPYTLRSSAAILYQISPSLEEASISLGCSPVKTFFKITAMMMLPGVLSGAILSWITVINELSSSVILYTGVTRTMSVSIYTEVIRASYGTAAALSTILTVTTIISLLIFFKVTGGKDVNI